MAFLVIRMLIQRRVCRQTRMLDPNSVLSIHPKRLYSNYTGPPPTEPAAGEYRSIRNVFASERSLSKIQGTGDQTIPRETDVVIVGGGLVGLSTAFWLKQQSPNGYSVTLIEKDTTVVRKIFISDGNWGNTTAVLLAGKHPNVFAIGGISTKLEDLSQRSSLNVDDVQADLEYPEVHYTPQGYLLLSSEADAQHLEQDHETQSDLGVKTDLMSADSLKARFPWLNVGGIALGSYGLEKEGWLDTRLLLAALKAKAASNDVHFVSGEVVGFATRSDIIRSASSHEGNHVRNVLSHVHIRPTGDDSRVFPLQFMTCFNCAGPWSREVARLAGIGTGDGALSFDLPIIPRRRFVYVFHCSSGPGLDMPMLVDTSGVFIRREDLAGNYVCATSPPRDVEEVVGESTEALNDYFRSIVQPLLAHRVPSFGNVTLVNSWTSVDEHNYFDAAPFVGNHPYHRNFAMATGLCGLGAQHAPAIGRALMEKFIYGEYRTLDLSAFTFDRILDDEPIIERLSL